MVKETLATITVPGQVNIDLCHQVRETPVLQLTFSEAKALNEHRSREDTYDQLIEDGLEGIVEILLYRREKSPYRLEKVLGYALILLDNCEPLEPYLELPHYVPRRPENVYAGFITELSERGRYYLNIIYGLTHSDPEDIVRAAATATGLRLAKDLQVEPQT